MTYITGWILVTMACSSSDIVLNLDEVKVNELSKDIFRSKVSELARVRIDPIPRQSIKELAAKFVVKDMHHVLSAKTETPTPSAPVLQAFRRQNWHRHSRWRWQLSSALCYVTRYRSNLIFQLENRQANSSKSTRSVRSSSIRCRRTANFFRK